jgi:hypothetical protein
MFSIMKHKKADTKVSAKLNSTSIKGGGGAPQITPHKYTCVTHNCDLDSNQ